MTKHLSGEPGSEPGADDLRVEMLTRAARSIEVAPLDAQRVVRAARAQRRRRRTTIASVLLAVVIVTGVSVATAQIDQNPNRPADAADTTGDPDGPPFPDPPIGTKWVGQNGVVVAVPAEWPVTESSCGSDAPAEVINGTHNSPVDCYTRGGTTARVVITPMKNGYAPSSSRRTCDETAPPTCIGSTMYREQNVLIDVQVRADDALNQVERILGSVMVLPDGWTTVPFAWTASITERTAGLEAAGFQVDVVGDVNGEEPVEAFPAFGSPVEKGATITLAPAAPTDLGGDLVVDVNPVSEVATYPLALGNGLAIYQADGSSLTYIPRTMYDSCLTGASATMVDEAVSLSLSPPSGGTGCNDEASRAVVVISGLTGAPTELIVTEDGETRTVAVTTGEATQGESPRSPPLNPDDAAPVARDLQRLAAEFVDYAVGDSDTFPHADSVSMSLGGQPVVSIDDIAAALSNREIWKICPTGDVGYAAASCPVDLLGPITTAVRNRDSLVYSANYGYVTCAPNRPGPLPQGRTVVLRLTMERRSCAQDFALVLAADTQGRLESIDLTISVP